jgi:hypothetical protein
MGPWILEQLGHLTQINLALSGIHPTTVYEANDNNRRCKLQNYIQMCSSVTTVIVLLISPSVLFVTQASIKILSYEL